MRWLLSWALYGLGDMVCNIMCFAEPFGCLYPVYNRLMGWSVDIQGEGDTGPWRHD